MDRNRKLAYNYLFYAAMLQFRSLDHIDHVRPWWRVLHPLTWSRKIRHVRFCGALANALHNLAFFSAHDYERFEEDRFWAGMNLLDSHHSGIGGLFRRMFEEQLQELQTGEAPPGSHWLPAMTLRPQP